MRRKHLEIICRAPKDGASKITFKVALTLGFMNSVTGRVKVRISKITGVVPISNNVRISSLVYGNVPLKKRVKYNGSLCSVCEQDVQP